MKGGIDDIRQVLAAIRRSGVKEHYLHCDAALFGMILPYTHPRLQPNFQYAIDSIAVSGHKFIGSPFPYGVVLVRKAHVQKIARRIEYVGAIDTTIAGSRSGHAPLLLWYAIRKRGNAGFRKEARCCLKNAEVFRAHLSRAGYPVFRNTGSIIVLFKKPALLSVKLF